MKALILIPSCARDRKTEGGQAALIWNSAKDGIDYRFFLGMGNCSHDAPAEVILPVRDDYWALPQKVRAAFRWALEQRNSDDGKPTYDYIFKCDRDTFIHADRLLAAIENYDCATCGCLAKNHLKANATSMAHCCMSCDVCTGYSQPDYIGLVGNPGDCCGGGAGYWLSRKAMSVYLENYDERQLNNAPYQTLEDWCLFTVLDRASPRISPVCDRRYWDLRLGPIPDPATNITWNPWKP